MAMVENVSPVISIHNVSGHSIVDMDLSAPALGHRHASRALLRAPGVTESNSVCSFSVVQRDGEQTEDGMIDLHATVPLTTSATATIVPRPIQLGPPVDLKVVGKSCDATRWGGDPNTHVLQAGQCKPFITNVTTCAVAGTALQFLFTQGESTLPVQ